MRKQRPTRLKLIGWNGDAMNPQQLSSPVRDVLCSSREVNWHSTLVLKQITLSEASS